MNRTQLLRDLGQCLWLNNITREILDNGTLRRYIDEFSITGLTSNPTIFDQAIGNTCAHDGGIRVKAAARKSGEAPFVELALEDLRRVADLFGASHFALGEWIIRPAGSSTAMTRVSSSKSSWRASPHGSSGLCRLPEPLDACARSIKVACIETRPESSRLD